MLLCALSGANYAKAKHPIEDKLDTYMHVPYGGDGVVEFMRRFVGDTIRFSPESGYIYNFLIENPDTLWLKPKRSKKPKEGKDYRLIYNYKGVASGSESFTRSRDIDGHLFGLVSVRPHTSNITTYTRHEGFELHLIDLEDASPLTAVFDNNVKSSWELQFSSPDRSIAKIKGDTLYYRTKSGLEKEYEPRTLANGNYRVLLTSNYDKFKIQPSLSLVFTDQKEGEYPLMFTESSYIHKLNDYITSDDYAKEQESKRVYTIDVEMPDSVEWEQYVNRNFPLILGLTKGYGNYVSQTVKPGYSPLGNDTRLPEKLVLLIGDCLSIRGKDYYKAVLNGKSFFVESQYVDLNRENKSRLDSVMSLPTDYRKDLLKYYRGLSFLSKTAEMQENRMKFKKYHDRGIIILENHPYDMSEYTSGTGWSVELANTSSKTIKYITFNVVGLNAVSDPVRDRGKTTIVRKGIGPIPPDESASYDFDYVWFTDIVEYSRLQSVTVQYMDGSTRTFTGAALKTIPSEIIEGLDYKDPVENFD